MLCVILQTTVVHREPATALTTAEWPGLWGIYQHRFQLSPTFNFLTLHGVIVLCHIEFSYRCFLQLGRVASILGRNPLEAFSDLPFVMSDQLIHQTSYLTEFSFYAFWIVRQLPCRVVITSVTTLNKSKKTYSFINKKAILLILSMQQFLVYSKIDLKKKICFFFSRLLHM